ncbi:hypothetical protein FWD07_02905 [Candidatus Saccharibacteria bacterium]|nr:hypothetical protein [Candidatus Saccharibacteria bacterium]
MDPILSYHIDGGAERAALQKALMAAFDSVRRYTKDFSLNAWRCILQFASANETEELARLDFTGPDGAGNNCAEDKLATLHRHPDHFATGTIPEDLLDPEAGDKKWLGAIAIPFKFTHLSETATSGEGSLRVSFSGALEHTDLVIATLCARHFRDALAKAIPNESIEYDYKGLTESPHEFVRAIGALLL